MRAFCIAMIVAALFTIWGLFMSGPASADNYTYLNRLAVAGYTGPTATWLSLGFRICAAEASGLTPGLIASVIVMNTGEGIYTPEAFEIIRIANDELCNTGRMAA